MQEVEFQEINQTTGEGAELVERDTALLQGVEVELSVQVGTTQIKAEDLFNLKKGQVVKLDEYINEPVKLMLDDHAIAHGKLMVSDDCFAIEILDIK